MTQIRVSGTLSLGVHTSAGDLHIAIERRDGGLVRVEPGELCELLAGLRVAAGLLSVAVRRLERARGNGAAGR